jgi:hypothetical protein
MLLEIGMVPVVVRPMRLRFMFNRKDNFIKAFVRAKKYPEIFLAA